MVLADNRAYDYNAREYLEQESPQPSYQPQNRPKKKPRPKLHLISITFVFAVAIFLISRYAYIAELNYSVHKLQKDYKTEQKNNIELNASLAKAVNLEQLEKTATEKLHMQYVDVHTQVVYVKVPVIQSTNSNGIYGEYSKASDVQENKYIAYAKNLIGSVMKVLD